MRVGEKRRFSKFVDQLTSVIERDTVTQAVRTGFSHGYDSAGNRTSDNSGSYAINNLNQITAAGYVYDNNGNLTSDPWRTYEWDAASRLTAINNVGGQKERKERGRFRVLTIRSGLLFVR